MEGEIRNYKSNIHGCFNGNKKTFELDEVHALNVLANYNDSYIIPGYYIRKVFRDDSYQIYGDVPSNGMQYQKK